MVSFGPLNKGFSALSAQPSPEQVKTFMEKNSRKLLHI
jgi:hypothetical protein